MELQGQFEGRVPYVFIDVQRRSVKTLVDTGYDGYLMFPQTLIESLGLRYLADTKYQTADGKVAYGSTYLAEIMWFGTKVQVEVDSTQGDFALLGMGLIYTTRLLMEPARNLLVLSSPQKA